VEARVTHVQRGVDGLERLKSEGELLLLALLVQDSADEDAETVVGDTRVELELLLGRCDGRKDGKTGCQIGPTRVTYRLTRDLMFEAVPYSVVSMLLYCAICEPELSAVEPYESES
jgi:hypothetical protein